MVMEQHSFHPIMPLLLAFVSYLAVSLMLFFRRHISQFTGKNLPPGNVGWPIIGETYNFVSSAWKGHPEKFISDRRHLFYINSSQVFKTSVIGEKTVFFCGAAGNKFLFSNENKLLEVWFSSSVNKIFRASPETTCAEDGHNFRKSLTKLMKRDALQRYFGIINQCTQSHFADSWENQNQVHALELAKKCTFKIAARVFVSLEDEAEIEKLSKLFGAVFVGTMSMPINFPGTLFYKSIKAANSIRQILYRLMKQRKVDFAEGNASPTQDLLSQMLLTCDEDGTYMKEPDIADRILGLIGTGYDTLGSALTFTVKYLGELPHIYDAVYKEQMEIVNSKAPGEPLKWEDLPKMKYSWNVAQEVLRLKPPVQGNFRVALTDFVYNGLTIPKGWKLYWTPYSTHKNADCFPEPEKFNPIRFEGNGPAPYTFTPFSGGPRMCPGNEYARVVMLVFMHNLVTRFKWENVFPDEKTTVAPLPTPTKGLPIRLYPHQK